MPTATPADTVMNAPFQVSMARARRVSARAALFMLMITGAMSTIGCASKSAAPNIEPSTMRTNAPPPGEQTTGDAAAIAVRLLEGGTGTRIPLRYAFSRAQVASVVMELSTRMTLAVGEMSPPEVRGPDARLFIQLRTTAVEPGGKATIEGTVAKFELPPTPGVAPAVIAAVTSDLDKLRGATFRLVVTDRGLIELLALPSPADANRQLLTMLDRVREGVRVLFPPLPEEATGKGARWEVHRKTTVGPAAVDETDVYTLAIAGQRGLITVKIAVAAREQNAVVAGLPPGATLTLAGVNGSGSGEIDLRPDRMMPASKLQWSSSATGSLQPAGEPPAPVKLLVHSALSFTHAE